MSYLRFYTSGVIKVFSSGLIILLLIAQIPLPVAAQGRVAAEIESLKTIYQENLNGIDKEFDDKIRAWPGDYIKELDNLQQRMQKSGDLERWQVVNKEMTRFKNERFIPSNAIDAGSAELATIQKKYQTLSNSLEMDKSRKILSLTEKYVSRLTTTQKNLTIAAKIDEALIVNAEIKRVKSLPKVSAAEFSLMAFESEKPDDQKARMSEEVEKNVDVAVKAEVANPAVEVAADQAGTRIYDGQPPPQIPGVNFKTLSLSGSDRMRVSKVIAVSAMVGKKSAINTSSSASIYMATHERSGFSHHYVRLNVKVSNTSMVLENATLAVQIFGKNLSGKGGYTELKTEAVKLPRLEGNRIVCVDCEPVMTSMTAVRTHSSSSAYISGASNTGQDFYGLVVSVFDGSGTIVYQGASTDKLEKMGIAEIPEIKESTEKLLERYTAARVFFSQARSKYISAPNNVEFYDNYLAASNQYANTQAAYFEAIGSRAPPFPLLPERMSMPPERAGNIGK